MMNRIVLLFCLLSVTAGLNAFSGVSPISIAAVPVLQFPPENYTIAGTRLSLLWGQHEKMIGLDLGVLGNITNKKFIGSSLSGLFNKSNDTTVLGGQLAGFTNLNSGNTYVAGVQAAFGLNYNSKGILLGVQMAAVNLSSAMDIYGIQIGGFNRADAVFGVQIGVVNMAKSLHGLQIGLLNFGGGGFLPFFPFLNFGI